MRSVIRPLLVSSLLAGLVLAGCGDDDDDAASDETPSLDDGSGADDSGDTDDAGDTDVDTGSTDGSAESDVTVTVDGTEYAVTTVQTCETETDTGSETDVKMFGFAESGSRIEFTLSYQGADTSPTGTVQYFGRVNVAAEDLSAAVTADDPFDFLTDDRSNVTGMFEMETTTDPIRTIEVSVDITCP